MQRHFRDPSCFFTRKKDSHIGPCRPWKYSQQAASRTFADLVLIAGNTRAGIVTAKPMTASPRTRCQLSAGARVNALLYVLGVNGLLKYVTTAVVYTLANRSQKGLLRRIRILRTIDEGPMSVNSNSNSARSCF